MKLLTRRERTRPTHHRSSSQRKLRLPSLFIRMTLALAALIITSTTAWLVATQRVDPVVRIMKINCMLATQQPCPAELQQQLQNLVNQPLLFSPLAATLSDLLASSGFSLVTYQRSLPDQLLVTVAPLPIGWAVTNSANQPVLAFTATDQPASVTAIQPETPRATITSDDLLRQIAAGQTPVWLPGLLRSLQDWSQTNGLAFQTITIRSPFDIEIALADQMTTYRLNPQELALNLNRLSYILKSDFAPRSATASGQLDVRFRVPVLRSAP